MAADNELQQHGRAVHVQRYMRYVRTDPQSYVACAGLPIRTCHQRLVESSSITVASRENVARLCETRPVRHFRSTSSRP
jgi:hypothetical protein